MRSRGFAFDEGGRVIRDTQYHAYVPKPANLAEWRLQRAVKRSVARDAAPQQEAPPTPGAPFFTGLGWVLVLELIAFVIIFVAAR